MDDARIVELFWHRSEEAISELSAKYGCTLLRIAENILGSRPDAEECVNDTYLAYWNTIPPENPKQLLAYACRILRNISISKHRKNTAIKRKGNNYVRALDGLEASLASPDTVERAIFSEELSRAINDFLGRLDIESRVMFVRGYFYSEHEYEFIGGKFRIAEGGGLCRIEFYYTMHKSEGGEMSEDECEKTARAAAGEFIDPEKYTVTRIVMHTESEFIYDRQVGNVSTALVDSVRVRVWEDGRLRSVEIITPGAADKMKEDEILRLGDSDEAISKIEDKLGSIFGSYDRYDIGMRHALILPDGSTGFIYVLHVYRGENIDGLFLLAAFGDENTDADTEPDSFGR